MEVEKRIDGCRKVEHASRQMARKKIKLSRKKITDITETSCKHISATIITLPIPLQEKDMTA